MERDRVPVEGVGNRDGAHCPGLVDAIRFAPEPVGRHHPPMLVEPGGDPPWHEDLHVDVQRALPKPGDVLAVPRGHGRPKVAFQAIDVVVGGEHERTATDLNPGEVKGFHVGSE